LPESVIRALEEAKTWQSEAWLETPFLIDGIEIRQMTLRHLFMLHGADSPFINKGKVKVEDIGVFLWIMSPDYTPRQADREEFCKKIKDVNIKHAIEDIALFFEITFADADTDKKEQKEYASFVAYVIDMFAQEYGWRIEEIMEMPMRQIYQLSSVIGERYARQNGKQYTKLRNVDMMEAKATLDAARAAKAKAKDK
jgi:hypothetical protein